MATQQTRRVSLLGNGNLETLAVLRSYRKKYGKNPPGFGVTTNARSAVPTDVVGWAEAQFRIPATKRPIVLAEHQKAWLNLALTRNDAGDLPYRLLVYSSIKKSGKSTIAGLIARWYAETQASFSEIFCVGNDREQAQDRSFREIRYSLELEPSYQKTGGNGRIPGLWDIAKTKMVFSPTGAEIKALAVDATGEAGGHPALQVWTELWGFEHEDAIRFWHELTPVPTIPDSLRMVETYAGYTGESTLLHQVHDMGKEGRQISAGELSRRTGAPLDAFAECTHEDDPVPIWENQNASVLMYWDEGLKARRMPWQMGESGENYYREQEQQLKPYSAYARLHLNEWSSATTSFVQEEWWDACTDMAVPPLLPGDKTPIVIGVDAATTSDCFAIVAVSRHPDPARHDDTVSVRAIRIFDPKEEGGVVDYDEAENVLRSLSSEYNVVQICYDSYQLNQMMQRLTKDSVAWCEPFSQMGERLIADKGLYDLILGRRITHRGQERLKRHVLNAGSELSKRENTLRLVKRSANLKIDAAVATSMATKRCLELLL